MSSSSIQLIHSQKAEVRTYVVSEEHTSRKQHQTDGTKVGTLLESNILMPHTTTDRTHTQMHCAQ